MIRKVQTSTHYKVPIHKDLLPRVLSCKIRQRVARDKAREIVDKQK